MALRVPAFVLVVLFAAAASSGAQSLGTFRWRLADFCSVLNLNVVQQGAVYTLDGFEEQCGGNPSLPVSGVAVPQANGTIMIGLTTIMPFGFGLHTEISISPSGFNGTWRDNANQSGQLVFNPGTGPFLGGPRISPIHPDPGVSGQLVESLQAEIAALRARLAHLEKKQP
jgi:hypothetical protein